MKKILCAVMTALLMLPAVGKAERKVVLVTVDGYRWQELFGGADSVLINEKKFGNVKMMKDSYWKGATSELHRQEWNHPRKSQPGLYDGCNQQDVVLLSGL